MKKYLFIYKSQVITNLSYIFNLFTGFIGFFIFIFIFLNLWNYIYRDPNEIINGYTMNQMIWYVVITEILWMILEGRKLCKKISDDVRSGDIACKINKPYSYILYILSSHLGDVSIKALLFIPLGIITGFIFLGSFPSLNILTLLAIFLTGILATVISTLIITFIGLLSFIIEDSNPFYWIYSRLILTIGTLFPIEYFPEVLQKILIYTPIYVVCYGPAKLFVDFTWTNFISVITSQVIYIGLTYSLCSLIYKKGVEKLNVNGG